MDIKNFKPKERFSDRVDNYVKYRPSYPEKIIQIMKDDFFINKEKIIADIGSGTGIFSSLMLKNKLNVISLEPNPDMRQYAENSLAQYDNFQSINGSAEDTTLNDNSVHAITVAQAFHWFDVQSAIIEFNRILKDKGFILLIWNDRNISNNDFQSDYNELIKKYCPDYQKTDHKKFTENKDRLKDIFNPRILSEYHLENFQDFDLNSLIGRLSSSSYCPNESDENYTPLINALKDLFEKYKNNGKIRFDYKCKLYFFQ